MEKKFHFPAMLWSLLWCKSISSPSARYGVAFEDISTRLDRDYWIAGSKLRIIELSSGKLMGERVGYMMDLAQGADSAGRSPWLFAADNACPAFDRDFNVPNKKSGYKFTQQPYQTERFVEKILRPAK